MNMAETIEVAKTGRARCRICRQPIEKGALRFGREQPSAFGEGMQWVWHHLTCAAQKKPVEVQAALAAFSGDIPNRPEIDALMAEGDKTATVFPYVERAPTGRSKCLQCREPIEKGALRVVVERELEQAGPARSGTGSLHPQCAGDFLEQEDLIATLRQNSRGLADVDLAELEKAVVG
jgi:Poly(ADP-ribose) polymerase and DNA-Ligase Zn-finger region